MHASADSSFVIDKRQGVCSGFWFPQQWSCHRAQILFVEQPVVGRARLISYKDDTLIGRRDVWIERYAWSGVVQLGHDVSPDWCRSDDIADVSHLFTG